jgi:branched-chain amino acid transport system ATP-binding protein
VTAGDHAPVLEVRGLQAAYGPVPALRDVSFAVWPTECVALVGPNGAGKTTTTRAVAGLVVPTGGQVRVCGEAVNGWRPWRIARAGLSTVPEGRAIFGGLTVHEHLRLSASAKGAGRDGIAAAYGAMPVLSEWGQRRAGTLSGGQQRLLALATALVGRPAVLVIDELSFGLSAAAFDTAVTVLGAAAVAGVGVVVTEQGIERIAPFATRVVVLDRGMVRFDGAVAGARDVFGSLFGDTSSHGPSD